MNLGDFQELNYNGVFMYVGLCMVKQPIVNIVEKDNEEVEEVTQGLGIVFFLDKETKEIYFVENGNIKDASTIEQWGVFSKKTGELTNTFEIEIDEKGVVNIFTPKLKQV